MANSVPKKVGGGMSLYANLLSAQQPGTTTATISSAPVKYAQTADASKPDGAADALQKKNGTVT